MGLKLVKQEISKLGLLEDGLLRIIIDIEGSCETAIETLNGLLDYEKLESGIMKLEKSKLSPWPLIRDSVKPFLVQVKQVVSN